MENCHIPIKKGLQKDVYYKGLNAKYIYYCIYLAILLQDLWCQWLCQKTCRCFQT